jgi:hypothetical protein
MTSRESTAPRSPKQWDGRMRIGTFKRHSTPDWTFRCAHSNAFDEPDGGGKESCPTTLHWDSGPAMASEAEMQE